MMSLTADKFISQKEEEKLFKSIEKFVNAGDKGAVVDHMLFQLLVLTGLRISEALALKWEDIGEDYLLIHSPKSGKKVETVHIGNKLLGQLAAFHKANPYAHSPYVFNTQKGPYKRTNAHDRLKYWLKVAGVRSSISLHSFRHTYATRCLDAGLPLAVVRDQLRHSSISVTSVYLHFSKECKDKLRDIF
jgi:integrase/recombinase XerD